MKKFIITTLIVIVIGTVLLSIESVKAVIFAAAPYIGLALIIVGLLAGVVHGRKRVGYSLKRTWGSQW